MLPDLRIVIAAVLSTFVLTVGVGFFASSRLINEPKKSTDSIAALDATPVNRIALSWPAPTRQPEPMALDFAVTAKALRNPVRDVTSEFPSPEKPSEPETSPVRTTATDLAVPPVETSRATPTQSAVPQLTPPQAEAPQATSPQAAAPKVAPTEVAPPAPAAAPAAVLSEAPKPAPEPDIRVAVQYPPIVELPPELQAPIVPAAPAIAAATIPAEPPATTGSIAEPPKGAEAEIDSMPALAKETEITIANRPEPADSIASDWRSIEIIPIPQPAPKVIPAKAAPKKAAPKKAAPKRVVRRPVRRAAPAAPSTVPNFFNMFTVQQAR